MILKSLPALIIPRHSPSQIRALPTNILLNKLAPNLPISIEKKKSSFLFFVSFLIYLITHFIDKPESSINLAFFMILSIPSFYIVNVVVLDPNIFFGISGSASDAVAVNLNGIRILLANGTSNLFY